MMYDVCCIGNWSGFNYGAHLTHFALFNTLRDKGMKVLMLEKPNVPPYPPLSSPELFIKSPYPKDALSPLYNNLIDMRAINHFCDTFIVGSDQLWNYDLFGHSMPFYTLSFVNSGKRKISYSTSLGHVPFEMPYEKKVLMKMLLKRFDKISIREKDGVDFCRNTFDITPDVTLDPVFLCDKDVYHKLMEKSQITLRDKYIFAYIVNFTEKKANFINKIKKEFGIRVICVADALKNQNTYGIDVVRNIKVEDWLALLNKSEYVIADSFHAYCFSLIFGKKVFPIYESTFSMNRVLALSDFLASPKPIVLSDAKFDYSSVDCGDQTVYKSNLCNCINDSMRWLEGALKVSTNKDDDIEEQIICLNNLVWELEHKKNI